MVAGLSQPISRFLLVSSIFNHGSIFRWSRFSPCPIINILLGFLQKYSLHLLTHERNLTESQSHFHHFQGILQTNYLLFFACLCSKNSLAHFFCLTQFAKHALILSFPFPQKKRNPANKKKLMVSIPSHFFIEHICPHTTAHLQCVSHISVMCQKKYYYYFCGDDTSLTSNKSQVRNGWWLSNQNKTPTKKKIHTRTSKLIRFAPYIYTLKYLQIDLSGIIFFSFLEFSNQPKIYISMHTINNAKLTHHPTQIFFRLLYSHFTLALWQSVTSKKLLLRSSPSSYFF